MTEAQEWAAYVARRNEIETRKGAFPVVFGKMLAAYLAGDEDEIDRLLVVGLRLLSEAEVRRGVEELLRALHVFSQEKYSKALDTEGGDMIHYGATT